MPYGLRDGKTWSRKPSDGLSYNQGTPLLVSSRGRYVWHESPYAFSFKGDQTLELDFREHRSRVHQAGSTLREAFLAAAREHFPPDGRLPPVRLFNKPQYNTWMELQYGHSQAGILAYAEAVIAHGFPPGVLMIDDTWQEDYGVWRFHPGRFPDPAAMMRRLHALGFDVMLWVCPFVSADSETFRNLHKRQLLVRDSHGDAAIRKWWNGYSAVLDGSHPAALDWLRRQLQPLMNELGVDGFKFDAGDPEYYRPEDRTHAAISPHGQCEAWARVGLDFPLNEYRACWKCAGLPLVQRLSDKSHAWNEQGLASLLPNALAQGLMGYAFICPDMIGGGLQPEFADPGAAIDQELFVRWAQCSALFPMMQFSVAPWRVLDARHLALCREAAAWHERFAPEIESLARHAAITGEPILRHLAYEFPEDGLESVNDQFMLGSRILVAPVLNKGVSTRTVHFPSGTWQSDGDGRRIHGPCVAQVDAPLHRLPVFRLTDLGSGIDSL
jgi:alpha-glucosidase (family GH31 glycosyl hydrolase)